MSALDPDTDDASLRHLAAPIAISSTLSVATALTESAALAGLAVALTGNLTDTAGIGNVELITQPVVILALTAVTFLLNTLNNIVQNTASTNWDAARRVDLIRAYREADFQVQERFTGSNLTAVANQVGSAAGTITAITGLINNITRTLVYLLVAFASSWQVSVVVVAAGGVLVLGLRVVSRKTRRMHHVVARRSVDLGDEVGDMASASRELHIVNRWDESTASIVDHIYSIRNLQRRSRIAAQMVGPIFGAGTILIGLGVVGVSSIVGPTGIAQLAAAGLLLVRALGGAQSSQVSYQQWNDAAPYLERVRDSIGMLRRARRPFDRAPSGSGVLLSLRGVSLSHGNDTVVRDLQLDLDGPGGIALVGPSGSGKSTTLVALAGLIDPSGGSIELNGAPLARIPTDELGHRIGLLPQDPRLLRLSLRSNLLRPEIDSTDNEMLAALDAVGLSETVKGFAGDLDTTMGRAGEGFSGGELQRLGLARLIVNQPQVWLLDEPTSALDRRNTQRVVDLINQAMQEHLVIVVTHRPEVLHHCKRVIYMLDGYVVDDGTLEELVSREPFVAAMLSAEEAVAEDEQTVHG